jgi:transposase
VNAPEEVRSKPVEQLLRTGLELRERYAAGEISERGMRTATGKLEAQLDRMLETRRRTRRTVAWRATSHMKQLWLFTFLHCFGLDATNNTAERALRGMVIARKVWGGSRTWAGACTHQILASVLRTCWQQGKDAFTRGVKLLRAPRAVILDIVPGAG